MRMPKEGNLDEVYNFILNSDSFFQPKLSSRVNLKDWSKKIFNNATRVEVRKDDELVCLGAAYMNKKPERSFGTYIFVKKEYQDEIEIGPTAMQMLVDYSEKYGSSAYYCIVRKSNKPLVRFYQKILGFSIEETKKYPNSEIEELIIVKHF